MSLTVRHNIEVAHRLSKWDGKCKAIHGHSMWIDLELITNDELADGMYLNFQGVPLEFGLVKMAFRHHLDTTYDHHLLLCCDDPWAQELCSTSSNVNVAFTGLQLPGLTTFDDDPTTENIAKWIAEWSANEFAATAKVTVHETAVNAASYTAL